jgi:hypothetical protein
VSEPGRNSRGSFGGLDDIREVVRSVVHRVERRQGALSGTSETTGSPGRRLIEDVMGDTLVELTENTLCCGFGGSLATPGTRPVRRPSICGWPP